MKNFILSIILIVIVAALLQLLLPWWIISVAAFAGGYLVRQEWWKALLAGFTSIFLLWAVYAYFITSANSNLLAHKVALVFPMGGHTSFLLLLTGLVGGLVGGLASLTGRFAANAFN